MQSLCTLRSQRRHWLRNTRYQADATPYLGRTSTGWIAPVRLAHSLDHLVCAGEQRRWDFEAECTGGRQVDHEFELGRSHYTSTPPSVPAFPDAARLSARR